jgi:hypothetical protein
MASHSATVSFPVHQSQSIHHQIHSSIPFPQYIITSVPPSSSLLC